MFIQMALHLKLQQILYDGYRNIQHSNMIIPKYPYIIGYYKGIHFLNVFYYYYYCYYQYL